MSSYRIDSLSGVAHFCEYFRLTIRYEDGMRRPCCWIGCIHRTDKAISLSVQWALSKQTKSK